MTLILASTSATRQSLLSNAKVPFVAMTPACNEEAEKKSFTGAPHQLALHLAKAKALSLCRDKPQAMILGADQTLLFEGEDFSKPKSRNEAHHMLSRLSGKTHTLQSALVVAQESKIIWQTIEEAQLTMRELSPDFISHYLDRMGDDILTSVGCYQIEGQGIQLFDQIEGDHFTILGLPLLPLLRFLRANGMLTS
jgi:septum formation protein